MIIGLLLNLLCYLVMVLLTLFDARCLKVCSFLGWEHCFALDGLLLTGLTLSLVSAVWVEVSYLCYPCLAPVLCIVTP